MGAWGTGLYSDDTTCEVRDAYRLALQQGLSAEAAVEQVLRGYPNLAQHAELASLVYFALADTAWKYGRLPAALKHQALALLESGADLAVWQRDAPNDLSARRRVLKKLTERLNSPQAQARQVQTQVAPTKKRRTEAAIGSVFSLALANAEHAVLVLVGYKDVGDSIDPVFSAPCWRGQLSDLPTVLDFSAGHIPFQAFQKTCQHVAILPTDERRSILSGLTPHHHPCLHIPELQADSVVWLSLNRIAKEIDRYLDAKIV